jgi:hypothetical protein
VKLTTFQTNTSGIFQEDHWYISHITYLLRPAVTFSIALEEIESNALPKHGKDSKFPQNFDPIRSDKPPVHDGKIIRESSSESVPKSCSGKEPTI